MTADVLANIDARITELEEELEQLRFRRRAILGGAASGRARRDPERDERIRSRYKQHLGAGRKKGAVRAVAVEFGLSTRQVRRILDAEPATPPSPIMQLPRLSHSNVFRTPASTSVDPSRTRSCTPDSAEEWDAIEDLLIEADGLAAEMLGDIEDARVPGGHFLDREDILRLVERTAYDLSYAMSDILDRFQALLPEISSPMNGA